MAQFNTRLALRYDTWANWNSTTATDKGANLVLLKGEIGICSIPASTNAGQSTSEPVILIKVGDGSSKFSALPWISAKAADVYSWAKAADVVFENEHILFKNATGETIKDLDLSDFVTTAELSTELAKYYTKEEIDDLFGQVVNTVTTVTQGTGINVTDDGTAGNHAYTVTLDVEGAKTALGLKSAAYETVENLNATAKGYADAVEAKIPTELGVMSIAKGNDAVEIGGTAKAPTVAVKLNDTPGNVVLTTDGGLKAAIDLSAYRLITDDENTQYHVEYDSTNKKIKLVAGADASKMEIDATDFIKDGMIETVELVQQDGEGNKGQFLKLTWNDDGNDITYVPVGQLVDVYTAAAGATEVQVAISNTNEISATLVNNGVSTAKIADKAVTEAKLSDEVATKLNKEWQPIGNYKTVQDAKDYTGSTVKTVTEVKQDVNGVITEVKFEDIAFPEIDIPGATGAATIASVANDIVTLKSGATLSEKDGAHTLANDTNADITLAKIAKTGKMDDLTQTDTIVFYCGTASEVL